MQGVLRAELPLKQLRLNDCRLEDGSNGLEAALPLLPSLEHLSIREPIDKDGAFARPWDQLAFNPKALQPLQQLTFLELRVRLLHWFPSGMSSLNPNLQFLRPMTRLVDLRLQVKVPPRLSWGEHGVTANVLAGASLLTHLEVCGTLCSGSDGPAVFYPAALSGKSQLQHLQLHLCEIPGDAAGVAQLLSQLQLLQQLTCLDLADTLCVEHGSPPAVAFSALTASSKLCHLNLRGCQLPAAAWQHVFPAGRQLLQLTYLGMADLVVDPPGSFPDTVDASASDGSSLVSCCPSLQSLDMWEVPYMTQFLAPLQRLSSLRSLLVSPDMGSSSQLEACELLGKLTGLEELRMGTYQFESEVLLPLAQLRHLTTLEYVCSLSSGSGQELHFKAQSLGDEPVWRQVLRHLSNHEDPDVAQQAAAALSR